mgnify:CR=1 FL=1
MPEKLFTKSAFKQAMTCPAMLYYYRNPQLYANQQLDDEFLQSLAEGGFQVGEAAKVYMEVPEANTIGALGYEESLARTQELFKQENVRIAEAAFRYQNCFIRADIIVKQGHDIKLYEVKSTSFDPEKDDLERKQVYIMDVTFQKWVMVHALHELYPGEPYTVTAYLIMADKSKKAPVDGINQMFKIVQAGEQKTAVRAPSAVNLVGTDPVVTPFNVDDICNRIITNDNPDRDLLYDSDFSDMCHIWADTYCSNRQDWNPVGTHCFSCPYRCKPEDNSGLRDGFKECWMHAFEDLREEDFDAPWISDLNGRKTGYWDDGLLFLEDMPLPEDGVDDGAGIMPKDRNLLIAGMLTKRDDILSLFARNLHGDAYLNIDALRARMDEWVYPLHMIDFETSAVALPFYKGMRPYESIAFQFSHHIIRKTGTGYSIEHAGQFINVEKGHFPNFDFVRALKAELEKDNGSIFRYAAHENTILNHIAKQLEESSEPDKDELIAFIMTITHETKKKRFGERDMIDLLDVVKKCYYHPSMKGSNSIKVVLPAVLNTSKFIQDKYSRPIYGTEIKSLNIPASSPISWITYDEHDGTVKNPYKLLPPVSEYLGMSEETMEAIDEAASQNISNGGAALTAYSELQFSDDVKSEALAKALLRYCELDTMAMVFIWEYFYHEVYGNA